MRSLFFIIKWMKLVTKKNQWVSGTNNLGTFGRWAFEEFGDVYEMVKEFKALIELVLTEEID